VFSAAVADATGNPARFGQIHQVQVALADDTAAAVLATVAADPDVAEVNDSRAAVAEYAGVAATVYALGPRYGAVVTDGRLPAAATEVALAPYTAGAMGVRPGDTVDLAGTRSTRELTVTGLAFVPEGEENYYNTGAWVSGAGWDELFDGASSRVAHVVLEPGADAAAVVARLDAALGPAPDGSPAARLRLDRDLSAELQQIRRLPLFLAGFLAVLAVGAVGHALGTAVRRRRHDLAVLRAGGMTRPQCRALVVTQAGVVAVAGLLAGLPLGVALGRTLWRYVADTTMVHYVPPAVVATLSLAVPVTLLVAAGLALWPAHRAAGLRVGPALRAE